MIHESAMDAVGAVNRRLIARALLDLLGCGPGDATEVGGLLLGHCPLHGSGEAMTLEVDVLQNRFRCGAAGCTGAIGGNLVELTAWTRGVGVVSAAADLVEEMALELEAADRKRLTAALAEEGRTALESGESEKAASAAARALRLDPDCSAARLLTAETLLRRGERKGACEEFLSAADLMVTAGELEEADRALKQAGALCPEVEDVFLARARIAELQGNPDRAARLLERVADDREREGRGADNIGLLRRLAELRPSDHQVRLRLAALHEGRRDIRSAVREMEQAAELLTAAGRGEEALPLIEKVLQIEPQRTRMRLALVERLVEAGQYELAKQHLFEAVGQQIENGEYVAAAQSVRRWIEEEPDSLEAREWLARIYQEQEMAAEAAGELTQAAELCLKEGETEKGLGFLFRAKFVAPDNQTLREQLVGVLVERGEGARAVFELMDLAELHFSQGMAEEAEGCLRRAAEADLSSTSRTSVAAAFRNHGRAEAARSLLEETARALTASGDPAGALACWEAVAEAEPADLESRAERLELLWNMGETTRAVTGTAELAALLLEEGQEGAALDLVRRTAGHLEEAGRESAPGAEPESVCALIMLCAATGAPELATTFHAAAAPGLRRGQPAGALRCAEAVLVVAPGHEPALRELADWGELAGFPEKAAQALVQLAGAAEQRSELQEAADLLARAARLTSARSELLRRRARLLENAGAGEEVAAAWHEFLGNMREAASPGEALPEYDSYLASHPADLTAGRLRAELLAQLGRVQEAGQAYEALLARAEQEKDLQEAVALREGLLALWPDDPRHRIALAGALAAAGERGRAVTELVLGAQALQNAGDLDRAALAAGRALELDANSCEALQVLVQSERERGGGTALQAALERLAALLEARGRSEEALAALLELTELRPEDPQPRQKSAELLDRIGNAVAALGSWLEAARLHAGAGQAALALEIYGRIRYRISEDLESLKDWVALAEREGTSANQEPALVALADAHTRRGEWDEARAVLKRLREVEQSGPELGRALTRLAEAQAGSEEAMEDWLAAADAYQGAGQAEAAGACLNRAVDAAPDNPRALERLADFYETQGHGNRGFRVRLALLRARLSAGDQAWRADLKALRERGGLDSAGRLAVARVLLIAGQREEAAGDLEIVAEAAREAEDHALVLEVCEADPRIAVQSGVLREAKAAALVALDKKGAATAWLRQCAEAALREGRPDEAEAYTRRWTALVPGDPDALGVMVGIHLQRHQPQLAFETSLAQGNFLWARGDYDGAALALRRALDANPAGLDARRFLWQVELDAGRQENALREMQALVDLLLREGEEREAYEMLRQMLRLEPRAIGPLRSMAKLIYKHRGFPKALPAYRRLLAALRDLGRVEEALAEYQEVLELEDGPVELRLEFADYLELLGQHTEAKRQYLEAGRYVRDVLGDYGQAARLLALASTEPLEPEDAEALEELGVLRRIARMAGQAAQAFREAARLHEAREYPERALECLQQALELVPGLARPGDLADMARLLVATGRRRDAVDACRRALDLAMEAGEEPVPPDQLLKIRQQLRALDPSDVDNALALLELLPAEEVTAQALEMARELSSARRPDEQIRIVNAALSRVPENLELRGEALALLRRQGGGEAVRAALADLCRTAAQLGDTEVARAALDQLTAMPAAEGAALVSAPLYVLCGEVERAVAAYCEASRELLSDGDTGGAAAALNAALALKPSGVPAGLVATLVRASDASFSTRAVALKVFDEALVQRARTRAAIVGPALLECLAPTEAAGLVRHTLERGGEALAALVAGVHADYLLARGRTLDAGSLVRTLTTAAPESAEAWKLASQVLERIGEEEAALAADERASMLARSETLPPDEGELGVLDEAETDDERVLESLASFYEHERRVGDAVRVLRRLSVLAAVRHDAAQAAGWLEHALSLSPGEPGLREELAERLVEAQHPKEAADHLRELTQLHLRREDTGSARTTAEHVLELDPSDERTAEFLLQLAEASGEADSIVRQMTAVARAQIASGDADRAYAFLLSCLDRFPNHPELLRALAACSKDVTSWGSRASDVREKRADEPAAEKAPSPVPLNTAIAQFELLLSLQPDDLDVLEILVNTCAAEGLMDKHSLYAEQLVIKAAEAGDLERASEAAETALTRTPELVELHRALGDALDRTGKTGQAVAEWLRAAEGFAARGGAAGAAECTRKVVEAEPENLRAWRRHADYLSDAGHTEEARIALEKVTEAFHTPSEIRFADTTIRRLKSLETNDPVAHERAYALEKRAGRKGSAMEELIWLVRFHLAQGNLDAAEKMIREGEELDRESLTLLECRAQAEQQRGDMAALRETLRGIIRQAGEKGNRDRARQALEKLRELASDQQPTGGHIELGNVLFAAGDREEAFAEFAAAVREDLAQGDPAAARGTAEVILRRHPGVPGLYAELAKPFLAAGRPDMAAGFYASAATLAASVGDAAARETYLREALAVRPRWAEGLLQLGESCAVGGDRAGAMEAFTRLEALYVEEERFAKAAEVVRRQITLNPKDLSLRERIAELYDQAGDKVRAAESFQELAEMRLKKGNLAAAVSAYRKLISLRPRDPAVLQDFAELLEKLGQGPEVVEAYMKLAESYSARGATVQAAEIYARVLGLDPDHTEARERLMALQK